MADFADHKDNGALRTIGEVAKATGIKTHVLRYWEQQFPQLQPLKRSGGRRYYRTEDVVLVERINRLVNQQGYTLKGAKAALKTGAGETDAKPAAPAAADVGGNVPENDTILPRLKAIRDDLKRALAA